MNVNVKEVWMMWHNYVMSISRKAWWLISWCIIYSLVVLGYTLWKDNTIQDVRDIEMLIQVPWVFFTSMPLWVKPLGDWVFRRGKYAERAKEKK